MTRKEITFEGRVQGVGFRATAERAAQPHDVTGWVRNEQDGSVRLVAEGQPDQIDAFLAEIRNRMGPNIHHESVQNAQPTGEFQDFSVRL